ncbi:MAG: hypothetical protein C4334_07800 [Pyrinomonas sp.]|uniref:GGDEF domain-containing protein n=1 Tax=Pyrinomonas sp. TaxID=2080306 RepID=UPI0033306B54
MSLMTYATASKQQKNERQRGRILLVMNERMAHLCGPTLEEAGACVVGVAGGMAAIVSIQRTRPNIVIAEIELNDLRAAELARTIANLHEDMPLIFVGAEESASHRRLEALSLGAFDYFQLPVELPLLSVRVTQLIRMQLTIERLRAEADQDYLTGLANRRRFRVALGQEVERWRRYKIPCSLLLVDVDKLKNINDAFGHSTGDVVIRHVAHMLRESSRDNDTAARLGGEEFALLLAGADADRAFAAAERLRATISSSPIERVGMATVSVGVASCPTHAISERELYAMADAALYRAKRDGRNCVRMAERL